MGRSPRNPAVRVESAWEAVRRALGRLFSRPRIHALSLESLPPAMASFSLSEGREVGVGRDENGWRPRSNVVVLALPQDLLSIGDADLSNVAVTISPNAALTIPVTDASPDVFGDALPPTYALADFAFTPPPVCLLDAILTPAPAHRAEAVLDAPRALRLTLTSPMTTPARKIFLGSLARSGRARASLATLAQVPWTLSRLPLPPDTPREIAWLAERQKLAVAANSSLDDVVFVGVFPRVPIGAVRALSLAEGGASLQIWLKADALGGPSPRLVTLILGSRRSTGESIRAVA